jgi:TetR/AcrR family transcriptional regulator
MVEKFSDWVESGLMGEVFPHHLMFMLWASTQTYADFSWQICTVMNKTELEEADFEQAASFIAQMVIKGCGLRSAPAIS